MCCVYGGAGDSNGEEETVYCMYLGEGWQKGQPNKVFGLLGLRFPG